MTERTGTVAVSHGAELLVRSDEELVVVRGRRKLGKAVCGDRVRITGGPEAQLTAIEPRENEFPRADRRGRRQVVAANIGRIVVVVAPRPEPTRDLINRYLVAAHAEHIDAMVCLNKSDLLDEDGADYWNRQADLYRDIGYRFVRACAKTDSGLAELKAQMSATPNIFVGQSGVGKSSLINRLIPDLELKTRAISDATAKGRHTTTTTTLYPRDDGGPIMDSPGVWEYGIWQMSQSQIAAGFVEFSKFAQGCHFANCAHMTEPRCAVAEAAEKGQISDRRLQSYRRIVRANESQWGALPAG